MSILVIITITYLNITRRWLFKNELPVLFSVRKRWQRGKMRLPDVQMQQCKDTILLIKYNKIIVNICSWYLIQITLWKYVFSYQGVFSFKPSVLQLSFKQYSWWRLPSVYFIYKNKCGTLMLEIEYTAFYFPAFYTGLL